MPRKQRFKPSRKPKPIEAPVVESARLGESRDDCSNSEPTRAYADYRHTDDVETGEPMRTMGSSPATIDETSG